MGTQVDDMFKLLELIDQMPRGAKRDNTETIARNFMDERSFVSLDGHEYLYGDDIGDRRREVYERARGYCEVKVAPQCSGLVAWVDGEMHHKQGGLVGRNDDMENLLWACPNCHKYEHRDRNPQFGKSNGSPSSDLDSDN